MKRNMAFIFLLMAINTAAADTAYNSIQRALVGEVAYVRALCPSNAVCVTDGTAIGINFQLTCADASFSFSYTLNSATSNVDIEAIEELEPGVSCLDPDPEMRFEAITLNMMFPSVTLNFLGTGVSFQIIPENITRDVIDRQKWWSQLDSDDLHENPLEEFAIQAKQLGTQVESVPLDMNDQENWWSLQDSNL